MVFSFIYNLFVYDTIEKEKIDKDDILKIEYSLTPNSMVNLPYNKIKLL